MVYILNGEILPDTDPRAIEARRKAAGGAAASSASGGGGPRFGANIATIGGGGAQRRGTRTGSTAAAGSAPQADPAAEQDGGFSPDKILDQVARRLGLADRALTVPPVPALGRNEETRIPAIYIVLIVLVLAVFGPKMGLAIILLASILFAPTPNRVA